jgi:hypothetical protein
VIRGWESVWVVVRAARNCAVHDLAYMQNLTLGAARRDRVIGGM